MANDLTALAPKLLAQGLMALRNFNVLPAIVNTDYSPELSNHGLTVDVPIPAGVPVVDVTPGNTPPSTGDVNPTTTPVTLDQWKEAPFYLTDKDIQQSMDGVIPMQASEAMSSLVDEVNLHILTKGYQRSFGFVGTPSTTPFGSDTTDATNLRKELSNQKCPKGMRRVVIDTDAEANALNLRAFQDASFSADPTAIQEGEIVHKLGFDWFADQQVPTHTTGGGSGWLVNNASVAVGDLTVPIDTGSGDPVVGDVFTVAGDTQTYVVESFSGGVVTFYPGAKVAWADNAAITFKASHVANIGFHRNAIAFVTRPMADIEGMGNIIETAVDPLTGLAVRLEISREHKRTRFSYDLLYGCKVIRPELIARLAG